MGLGFVVGIIGGFLIAHAAFSVLYYSIGELKIMEEQFTGPPFNVVIELLVGLGLCLWAGLAVPTKFLSILPHSDENRVVSLSANLDFMVFNHRGKVLPSNPDLKLKI